MENTKSQPISPQSKAPEPQGDEAFRKALKTLN
jgi:hypothetical protein